MYNLALMYSEGEGVKQDPGKAIDLMERAAEQGLAQVWQGNWKGQIGLLKIICITFIIVLEIFAVFFFFLIRYDYVVRKYVPVSLNGIQLL